MFIISIDNKKTNINKLENLSNSDILIKHNSALSINGYDNIKLFG